MEFDIASVAVGATVGAYSDANGLPIGTTYHCTEAYFPKKSAIDWVCRIGDHVPCRTNASSTFNAAVGTINRFKPGFVTMEQRQVANHIYVDHVTDNSNRVCTNASCSTFFNTNWADQHRGAGK